MKTKKKEVKARNKKDKKESRSSLHLFSLSIPSTFFLTPHI